MRRPAPLPPIEWLQTHFEDGGDTLIIKASGCRCTYTGGKGRYYTRVTIDGVRGKRLYVHRVLWKMRHGTEPWAIDHIDGNPLNNHPDNLRECSDSANQANTRLRVDNTTGHKNVTRAPGGKWRAQLQIRGSTQRGPTRAVLADAIVDADELRRKYFGEFANGGVPSNS